MENTAAIDWASLETHVTSNGTFSPPTKRASGPDAKIVKFPCTPCQGTGKYRGVRLHQPSSDCFACGGKGYFKTSERDRQNARKNAANRKAQKTLNAVELFETNNPGVIAYLTGAAKWSSFAANMLAAIMQYGDLTSGQFQAVLSMQAKTATRQAEKEAAASAAALAPVVVDFSPIRAMFETAVTSGYKKPIYRAAGLVITRAPDHGNNPGALYVKTDANEYLGKIVGTNYLGKTATALVAIAADPKGEAIRHGQRTGSCSCCGRTLTKHASIEAGIGPICATKWGI